MADANAVSTSSAVGDTILHDISAVPAQGGENTNSVNAVEEVEKEITPVIKNTESVLGISESEEDFVDEKAEAISESTNVVAKIDEGIEPEVVASSTDSSSEAEFVENTDSETTAEDEDEEDGADSLQAFLDNGAAFGMEF